MATTIFAAGNASATKKRRPADRHVTDPGGRSTSAPRSRGDAEPVADQAAADAPSEEAVAALRSIVLQLNERIVNLQREAAEERAALAAASAAEPVRAAWAERPDAGAGPAPGLQQYVAPPRYACSL